MARVFNFSAGPAMLPTEVMEQAQAEFMDWQHSGMSVMEISHRSAEFMALAKESTDDLRELLNVPNNYRILFLHGGARSQFAMVPMNLLNHKKQAAYVQTGVWSKLAAQEARLYCDVKLVADTEASQFTSIPPQSEWQSCNDAAYLYYVDNETVNGVEFHDVPESHGLPLVSDMSSNILSRPFDVAQYGVVFACAQKNLGPAGVTCVIIRDDLLQCEPIATTPSMFRYQEHAAKNSLLNTSPTYPWYMVSLVLKWVKKSGGVAEMAKRNARKSQKLYDYIDANDFYRNPVAVDCRSRMNVIFTLPTQALDAQFVEQATRAGLTGLKGHRFVGGLRASIYNAMPEAGVDALLNFMDDFKKKAS